MSETAQNENEATYTNEQHKNTITLQVGDTLVNYDGETATVESIEKIEVGGYSEPHTEIQLSSEDERTAIWTLEAAMRKGNIQKTN